MPSNWSCAPLGLTVLSRLPGSVPPGVVYARLVGDASGVGLDYTLCGLG